MIPAYASGMSGHLWILLFALGINAVLWRNRLLVRAVATPLALGARMLDILEQRYNRAELSDSEKRTEGISVLILACFVALIAGFGLQFLANLLPFGWIVEALALSVILTQRNTYDELRALRSGLERSEAEARAMLALIGQRDVEGLDHARIAQAGIEISGYSFNRGVMAPSLYMLLGGLPLAFLFKIINVADRMSGAKTRDAAGFGHSFSLLNGYLLWPASILSGLAILLNALLIAPKRVPSIWSGALKAIRVHPIAREGLLIGALAAALNIRLGGPRSYAGRVVNIPTLGDGVEYPQSTEIDQAIKFYFVLCAGVSFWTALSLTLLTWQ